MSEENNLSCDVLIVGAGVSGLAAAIRLKKQKPELNVMVLEKGSEVGAHILSGAVLEPRALDELLPDWKEKDAPIKTAVTKDEMLFMTTRAGFRLPAPPQMHNKGNYIVSLANVCRWLATIAAEMGVEIFTGFAGAKILMDQGKVVGVQTGDMGIGKDGQKKASYQEGVKILAQHTLFAEGCRGSLSEQVMDQFDLRSNCEVQTYGIGIKEIWDIDPKKHKEGKVSHSVGWPLDKHVYGGAFLYHMENHQLSVGFVIGLDYENPYLNPYEEFQKFKTHPIIKPLFEGGKRIAYGARALNEGGYQSIPKLTFPGGALIGCSAGFLNVAKIKGSHTAMKSGMLAADAIVAGNLNEYEQLIKESWVYEELYQVRNVRPGFHKGLYRGLLNAGKQLMLGQYKKSETLSHGKADYACTKKAEDFEPIPYPKPDGKVTFDKLTSVQLSGTNHDEDQPKHLKLTDSNLAVSCNLKDYAGLEQYYCPAKVYEYIDDGKGGKKLQINAANCVHCKTCDIKDPNQNINWTVPEGGGGPRYPNM